MPTPAARQRPLTSTVPDHSRVSNTPGLTHQCVTSVDANAQKTLFGVAASSTVTSRIPPARFTAACGFAEPVIDFTSRDI
jgi:hypothetical protein